MVDRSCRFPNTDPHQLWILLAGRKMSLREWKHWSGVLFGGRKWFFLIAFITTLFFLTDMIQSLTTGFAWYEIVAAVAVLLVALPLMVIPFIRLLRTPTTRMMAAYEEYAADVANGSVRIALYGDYIKMVSKRQEITVRYDEITVYRETEHGFLLGDGTEWIVIRAADLTPYLADILRAYLSERIDERVRVTKRHTMALLQQPITPIPYYTEVTPFATAQVPWKTTPMARAEKQKRRCVWQIAAMLGLFLGVGVALWAPITPWFLIDLAGCCVGVTAMTLGFTGLVIARSAERGKPQVADISFEPDGLRVRDEQDTRFYVKERFWVEEKAEEIQIRFVNGDTLCVPYAVTSSVAIEE